MSEPAVDPGTTDATPLIEVRGLHVGFAPRRSFLGRGDAAIARAVDGVDLTMAEGEILALAGESGCGKTTLARSLMGFVRPQLGEILFEGRPVSTDLRAYRRQVQMVYQDPTGSLNPRQTIYDSVAEGPRIHKLPGNERAIVASALSRAGLRPPERFFHRFPHQLSGGQRQRVVIAGALALEPRVLIADEPVSNLDASVRGEILRLLLELRRTSRITILIVTHDLGLAWMVADRVAVMYLGRIVEVGPTRDVLTDPRHPYTRALLRVAEHGGAQALLSGEPPDPTRIPAGCRFHPRCPALEAEKGRLTWLEPRCLGDDPRLGARSAHPDATSHLAACHLAESDAG